MFRANDSKELLAYIIRKCAQYGYKISYTKCQKLMYCCYGAYLAQFGKRLVAEHPHAWSYGPAFPRAFNAHHKGRIDLDAPTFVDALPQEEKDLVDGAIQHFGQYNATSLTNWSHLQGSPWDVTTMGGKKLYDAISDVLIGDYFKNNVIVSDSQQASAT
ncbi:MAG: DUF4065 domain-containing protein [Succinivibrio sp.]|nr:DUF4065 domain-containing protein [Succinivibrio sp.]